MLRHCILLTENDGTGWFEDRGAKNIDMSRHTACMIP